MINRVIWIILDSVGMGELPDAARFGDKGADTLGNIAAKRGKLSLPNMRALGLGNIEGMKNIPSVDAPKGCYARLAEISEGKDTTIGHWEMIGITEAVHTKDNMDGVQKTLEYMSEKNKGVIFTNLVEFDMKWGHRNDIEGYANGLEEFDQVLPKILEAMKEDDILIINADHGCDPTIPGTDHTREYVPLLVYGKALKENVDLKTGKTFADIGQTIAEIFGLAPLSAGESFLNKVIR